MIFILDNGHGAETPGKRSPDGKLREYAWTREMAQRVAKLLRYKGHDARILVPEQSDISLRKRCVRANDICREAKGKSAVALLSIHNDAAGNGGVWAAAQGMSARVAYNASNNSKRLAKTVMGWAKVNHLLGNRCVPAEGYWLQDLAMCRDTWCPAVLVECLFQDNKRDCEYLLAEEGKENIASTLCDALCEYAAGVK